MATKPVSPSSAAGKQLCRQHAVPLCDSPLTSGTYLATNTITTKKLVVK